MATTILIVEDDEPTQRLMQVMLTRSGYAFEIASNGAAAIERLHANDYAAVVLDMMMPEVGGHEVIEFLTAAGRRTPVVICTAAPPAVFRDINADIVKAVVRKPFDVEEFLATLNRVTGER